MPVVEEAVKRVVRRFDDRLALDVEGRVQQHRHAGERVEFLEQPVKPLVVLLPHRLHARRAVDVNDGRDLVAPFRAARCLASSMNGESSSPSKISCARSASTIGANGRNACRCLTRLLSLSFISAVRGSARMLRLPSARGPNSERPWNQPNTLPSDSNFAVSAQILSLRRRSSVCRRGSQSVQRRRRTSSSLVCDAEKGMRS